MLSLHLSNIIVNVIDWLSGERADINVHLMLSREQVNMLMSPYCSLYKTTCM